MKNMINMEGIDERDFEPFIYPNIVLARIILPWHQSDTEPNRVIIMKDNFKIRRIF